MNKAEIMAMIAEVSISTKKEIEKISSDAITMVKTGEYDFVNSNRPRPKKGKIKKNWER